MEYSTQGAILPWPCLLGPMMSPDPARAIQDQRSVLRYIRKRSMPASVYYCTLYASY